MTEQMTAQEARMRLRKILAGAEVVRPASVFDALTARAAARLGFRLGMLGGSVAALAVLGAPDHALLSLDEFAGLSRRICRAGALPLLVDADHGFGTALHAQRCVEELEAAGVAGMTLEDTDLPRRFGTPNASLVSLAEHRAKLDAAVAARSPDGIVIVARTDARLQDGESLVERAKSFGASGAEALFITGARDRELVARAHEASGLPLIVPEPQGELAGADLAAMGVRICLTPHRTLPAAMKAAWDSLAETPGAQTASRPERLMAELSEVARYDALMARYLDGER